MPAKILDRAAARRAGRTPATPRARARRRSFLGSTLTRVHPRPRARLVGRGIARVRSARGGARRATRVCPRIGVRRERETRRVFTSLEDLRNGVVYCVHPCDEASDWDVSQLTSLSGAFQYMGWFNANISGWDTSSVTDMGNCCLIGRAGSTGDISGVGHELCDRHGGLVQWGDSVQRGRLWVEHELCDRHGGLVQWGDSVQRGHLWVGPSSL